MAQRNYSSTAVATTITSAITNVATTCSVASTAGFPAAPFIGRLDADTAAEELVLVTNVAGTTLTITRGYDSTSAQAHSSGASFRHSVAAIDLREANSHVNASSAVHGLAGTVVGTSDTQTLTNKTLTSPTINTPTVTNGSVSFPTLALKTGPDLGSGRLSYRTSPSALYLSDGTNNYVITPDSLAATLANKTLTTPVLNNPTLSGASGALTLPAGPDTIVGRATTDTLTNKTMSGASNTFSAIPSSAIAGDAWASYTPTWTGSTTNPALGNGTIEGRYHQIGKTVHFRIRLTMGSTTTYGSGLWRFSLPVAAVTLFSGASESFGNGNCYDTSGAARYNRGSYSSTQDTVSLLDASGTAVSATAPFTWAVGDTLSINGTYEAA